MCIKSIMFEKYPPVDLDRLNSEVGVVMDWLKSVVTAVREHRAKSNISQGVKLELCITTVGNNQIQKYIERLANVTVTSGSMEWKEATELIPYVFIKGSAPKNNKNKKLIEKLRRKLADPGFLANAKEEVIAAERNRLTQLEKGSV